MFTIAQIEQAHKEANANFPRYIKEIKKIGVKGFETWVKDNHTAYYGENNFSILSVSKYEALTISEKSDKDNFIRLLKKHQRGETSFFAFCKDCAENGIEKWVVNIAEMTCIYYDTTGKEILTEKIPE